MNRDDKVENKNFIQNGWMKVVDPHQFCYISLKYTYNYVDK